jgi:aspartokinase
MVTIAHVVEDEIRKKPFLHEALGKGIINNAALAQELIPKIEATLHKKVKFSAVNMAIRRLSEKVHGTFITKPLFDRNSDLLLQSDLVEITLYKSENVQEYIQKVYAMVDYRKGDFLCITQGVHEVMIITNHRHASQIKKLIPSKFIRASIEKVSSISVRIPESAVDTVGLFYIVTRALNWEDINVIDIVSTYTEMTFILRDRDVSRAYDVLQDLIATHAK